MIYRETQSARDRMEDLQGKLREAILAERTRDILAFSGEAQTIADQLTRSLENALKEGGSGGGSSYGRRVEQGFVHLAARALSMAVVDGEKVALGQDALGMRNRLFDFKTHVDFADAYLHAALGADES